LCSDLRTLWRSPSVTNRDRAEIFRTIIRRIVLEWRQREQARIRVEWADGGHTIFEIATTLRERTRQFLLKEYDAGTSLAAIAQQLNDLGWLTHRGDRWDAGSLEQKLNRLLKGRQRK